MKITRVEAWSVDMKLAEPYAIAYETISRATTVFLRVETNADISGFGCAAPDEVVTGETPDSALSALDTIVGPILKGADPLRRTRILARLRQELANHPSVRAAADMALHDILGKAAALPLWRVLGGFRRSMPTSVTIGIVETDEAIVKAKELVKRGFRALKIKGGRNLSKDIERILAVREAIGPRTELRFDANQGYSVEEALELVRATRSARIEIFEQPTPREKPELLGRVAAGAPMAVMADESLMSSGDALSIARDELADMINVKLMKVGGIDEAVRIDAVASAANIEVMVGCMDESALSIAAGLHYALARPNVAYADLDGHLDLIGDPAAGAVILHDGLLFPTEGNGLGFDLP